MNPRVAALIRLVALAAMAAALFLLFPVVLRFAEGAARSAFRFWWFILLIGLGCWLIWGMGRKPR